MGKNVACSNSDKFNRKDSEKERKRCAILKTVSFAKNYVASMEDGENISMEFRSHDVDKRRLKE